MIKSWECLSFWRSQEWIEIQEKLDALDRMGHAYNPQRHLIFAALDACPLSMVKVAIFGQDPYPQSDNATGIAFSIPPGKTTWPATLCQIIREYCQDLGFSPPLSGNLERWCEQGVLLWNVCPTYQPYVREHFRLNEHYHWKWHLLTEEIIKVLNEKVQGVVFCFLGKDAREFEFCVDDASHPVICTSHPSPLGSISIRNAPHAVGMPIPFIGSRLFTKINDHLVDLKYQPIDWKLPGSTRERLPDGFGTEELPWSVETAQAVATVLFNLGTSQH